MQRSIMALIGYLGFYAGLVFYSYVIYFKTQVDPDLFFQLIVISGLLILIYDRD